MAEVKYVERNQIMKALQAECVDQTDAPWNLIRTTVHDWDFIDPPTLYEHDPKGKIF